MTRAELLEMLASRKAEKSPLTVVQLLNALDAQTPEFKQQLADAVNARDAKIVAELVIKLGNKKRKALAVSLVTDILADDIVQTAELLDLL